MKLNKQYVMPSHILDKHQLSIVTSLYVYLWSDNIQRIFEEKKRTFAIVRGCSIFTLKPKNLNFPYLLFGVQIPGADQAGDPGQ